MDLNTCVGILQQIAEYLEYLSIALRTLIG